ncbi:MAG: tetratricopeptide repeat protein [Flavobacteriales bacterium]
MKTCNPIYMLVLIATIGIASFLQSCTPAGASRKDTKTETTAYVIPELLPRSGKLSETGEWQKTMEVVGATKAKINNNSNDFESYIRLAEIFINEARVTGEHGYYYPSTLGILNHVMSLQITDEIRFKALSLESSVYLSLHQFAKAKETAEQAVALNPNVAQIYGALVDANVELGNYAEAVKMAEKMMDIRPDLISYSRASYLREIHGDPNGAIEVMNMAVESGYAGYENLAWTRNTLGEIHETYGDIMSAEMQYKNTLMERPDYPFAIAGLASVEKKKGNLQEAERLLLEAAAIIPEVSFYAELAYLYKETNRAELAQKKIEEVLVMMADDEAKGHVMNLEYAKLYLNLIGDTNKALEYAKKEYDVRPMNIDVNKVMADIYFQKGMMAEAEQHLSLAMATGSQNPELLMLAGAIYKANGNNKVGEQFVRRAIESNPYLQLKIDNTSALAIR